MSDGGADAASSDDDGGVDAGWDAPDSMSPADSGACQFPRTTCGATCADLTSDSSNCGACGHACTSGQPCVASMCSSPPAPPRLVAPLSTATTTSQSPTLRWQLAPGTTGAQIQVCADRACAMVEQTHLATGSSVTAGPSLRPGVHYWRALGVSGAVVGVAPSPTWEFWVGARSAAVDTSWGTVSDFDGDGFADVVIGASRAQMGAGRVYIYAGSAAGIATTPTLALDSPAPAAAFGTSVASAGDVNGDGFADLLVAAPSAASSGRVYVYLGRASGLATTPATTLSSTDGTSAAFGTAIAAVGDSNGDGFADVVVAEPNVNNFDGRVRVYLGSATGLASASSTQIDGPSGGTVGNSWFGRAVSSAGDLDGDGYGDLVVGAPGNARGGSVYVYLGGVGGYATTAAETLVRPATTPGFFGSSLACAGDVDGDGNADIIVGATGQTGVSGANNPGGQAYLYRGLRGGLGSSPATTYDSLDGGSGSFGASVAGVGDVNGDGYGDAIVGAPGANSYAGAAHLFLGSAAGLAPTPVTTMTGPAGMNGTFGSSVAGAGDVDRDGYADVLAGAPGLNRLAGEAYLFHGNAAAVSTTASPMLPGPDVNGYFGVCVARADSVVRAIDPAADLGARDLRTRSARIGRL